MASVARTVIAAPLYLSGFYLLSEGGVLEFPTAEWLQLGSFIALNLVTGLIVRDWLAALLPLSIVLLVAASSAFGERMFENSDTTVGGFYLAVSLVAVALVAFGVVLRRGHRESRR